MVMLMEMRATVKVSALTGKQLKMAKILLLEFDDSIAPENTPLEPDIDNSWSPWPNKIVS